MPQIGRPTLSNDRTSFGSEIARLNGELLADTTQMAPYIQITWEPHLKTLTSSETYPQKYRSVDRTNMSTFEEMSVWNCTTATWYKKGSYPFHIDSSCTSCGCDFDGIKTDVAISSEDNFGYYFSTNPKFRCTSNPADTTQFWIGGK